VPRQNPLPQIEVEICERLRLARQATKLSQVAFANLVQIDSSRLASYEHARVPIRFDMALKLGRLADVSLRWLAEGVEPKKNRFRISESLLAQIPKNCLFSEAWQHLLKPSFDQAIKKFEARTKSKLDGRTLKCSDITVGGIVGVGYISASNILSFLNEDLSGVLKSIPPHLLEGFYAEITNTWRHFVNLNIIEIHEWESRMKNLPKKDLPHPATFDKKSEVKPQLPNLLERLNRATRESGKMSALADYLKVPLASVSRWLSGKREPGGEIALKLLQWVEQQERQK